MLKIRTEHGDVEAVVLGTLGANLLGHVDGIGRKIGSWEAVDQEEFWRIWHELGGSLSEKDLLKI